MGETSRSLSNLDSSTENPEADLPICYICHCGPLDDPGAKWINPCGCRGDVKWVHEHCLRRWICEKQEGNTLRQVNCQLCGFQYRIRYPSSGVFLVFLQAVDSYLGKVCPLILCSIICGSVYWLCVTHGALTIIQIYGHECGICWMKTLEPFVLLGWLAGIPSVLIASQIFPWEEKLVKVLQKCLHPREPPTSVPPVSSRSSGRLFCYALLLPTIACGVGKLLFGNVTKNPLKRALLGGAVTVLCKSLCVIYYKYNQLSRFRNSIILNFDDTDEDPLQSLCCVRSNIWRNFSLPFTRSAFDGNELCCLRTVLCAKQELVNDLFSSTNSKKFGCEHAGCTQVFSNENEYQGHCLSTHSFKCISCTRTYPSAHLLDLHITENHDPMQTVTSFHCFVPSCPDVFPSQHDRRDHCITIHKFPSDFRYDSFCRKKQNTETCEASTSSSSSQGHTAQQLPRGGRVPSRVTFGRASRCFGRSTRTHSQPDATSASSDEPTSMDTS
uniref:E3 ubiquitin-protein ligase MARCHF5 n=1 Tax=Trichuris muris TaxID=70415 RepID=A0A5S6R0W9_TRIMR